MAKKTEAKNKKQRIKEKRVGEVVEELPVRLTPEEFESRARELAQCEIELRDEQEHADTVKKGLKEREGVILVKRSRLSGVVRTGKEPRPVRVERWIRYDEGIYEEVRLDTGEILPGSRRQLSPSERQVDLPLLERPSADQPLTANIGDRLEKPLTLTEAKAVEEDTKAAKKTSKRASRELTPVEAGADPFAEE